MGGEDVAGECFVGVRPRVADVGHAGEVIDGVRPNLPDGVEYRVAVVHLDREPSDALAGHGRLRPRPQPSHDQVVTLLEELEQVATDEAGGARDENRGSTLLTTALS